MSTAKSENNSSDKGGTIRVGVAGWSYPDWEGTVYPKPKSKNFDPLPYLASFLDVIEINSTFYRPAPAKHALSWASRVERFSDFRFTVKLWQRFTHDLAEFGEEEVVAAKTCPAILAEAGRLGALLVQFPWSFKNGEGERKRIIGLMRAFSEFPLVFELRHQSWNMEAFYDLLDKSGAGFANIDQPVIGKSIEPSEVVAGETAYVRLHGRNYTDWFRQGAGRDDRYNYLYSREELSEWAARISRMADKAGAVYAIANNHYKGQAVANAVQLKHMLGQQSEAPPPLALSFGFADL